MYCICTKEICAEGKSLRFVDIIIFIHVYVYVIKADQAWIIGHPVGQMQVVCDAGGRREKSIFWSLIDICFGSAEAFEVVLVRKLHKTLDFKKKTTFFQYGIMRSSV